MEFKTHANTLVDMLIKLNGIVPKTTVKPILKNILMIVSHDTVTLMATDLVAKLSVVLGYDIDIKEPGIVLIDAIKFLTLIKSLGGQECQFKSTEKSVNIKVGKSKFKFITSNSDQYPEIVSEEHTAGASCKVKAKELSNLINKISFSVNENHAQIMYQAILLKATGTQLECVGTDGNRLAWGKINAEVSNEFSRVVPAKNVGYLSKLVSKTIGDVSLESCGTVFVAKLGTYEYSARTLEGRYPNYESMLPMPNNPTKITINRDTLINTISQVLVFAEDGHRPIRIVSHEKSMELFADCIETGEAHVELECKMDKKEDFSISVSSQSLLDVLKMLDTSTVEIICTTNKQPVRIYGNNTQYCIMPLIAVT